MILGNFVRAGSKQPETEILAIIKRVVLLMVISGVLAFVVGVFLKWFLD